MHNKQEIKFIFMEEEEQRNSTFTHSAKLNSFFHAHMASLCFTYHVYAVKYYIWSVRDALKE